MSSVSPVSSSSSGLLKLLYPPTLYKPYAYIHTPLPTLYLKRELIFKPPTKKETRLSNFCSSQCYYQQCISPPSSRSHSYPCSFSLASYNHISLNLFAILLTVCSNYLFFFFVSSRFFLFFSFNFILSSFLFLFLCFHYPLPPSLSICVHFHPFHRRYHNLQPCDIPLIFILLHSI